MDISPVIPAGRQRIERYGNKSFLVSGQRYEGSVLVFPEMTLPWSVAEIGALTVDSLSEVAAARPPVELLLLGMGGRFAPLAAPLRQAFAEIGLIVEAMDTGAACRTYNVLMAEDRRVAAALIAVP